MCSYACLTYSTERNERTNERIESNSIKGEGQAKGGKRRLSGLTYFEVGHRVVEQRGEGN